MSSSCELTLCILYRRLAIQQGTSWHAGISRSGTVRDSGARGRCAARQDAGRRAAEAAGRAMCADAGHVERCHTHNLSIMLLLTPADPTGTQSRERLLVVVVHPLDSDGVADRCLD